MAAALAATLAAAGAADAAAELGDVQQAYVDGCAAGAHRDAPALGAALTSGVLAAGTGERRDGHQPAC